MDPLIQAIVITGLVILLGLSVWKLNRMDTCARHCARMPVVILALGSLWMLVEIVLHSHIPGTGVVALALAAVSLLLPLNHAG
jgi:tryptophan-rich sensory protein